MPNTKDFVPKNDAAFVAWSTNFFTVVNANLTALSLTPADITFIQTAQTNYANAFTAQVTAEAAAKGAVANKTAKRKNYEPPLRTLVRRIQASPGITDSLRGQLKITVPTRTRTRRGVGTEVPNVALETLPSRVVIHFGTNAQNERVNGKPDWAAGCNIYRKVGTAEEYSLIVFESASPFVDKIEGAATNVSYRVSYRGIRSIDEGAASPEMTVAAGG